MTLSSFIKTEKPTNSIHASLTRCDVVNISEWNQSLLFLLTHLLRGANAKLYKIQPICHYYIVYSAQYQEKTYQCYIYPVPRMSPCPLKFDANPPGILQSPGVRVTRMLPSGFAAVDSFTEKALSPWHITTIAGLYPIVTFILENPQLVPCTTSRKIIEYSS